ncbi:MAG: hypothetical protein COA78_25060 [Blastopirellula sp.]|nr:MAG: hypothetical protein COA78_25060 [Blastopirellula sp.]
MDKVVYLCGVPYREISGATQLCLTTHAVDVRWGFHYLEVKDTGQIDDLITAMQEKFGLKCRLAHPEPINSFAPSRTEAPGTVHAFLLEVLEDDENHKNEYRRKWCFPVEAKLRIRRKPVQWLVDDAMSKLS